MPKDLNLTEKGCAMKGKAKYRSPVGVMGFTLALFILASAQVAAQSSNAMTPELQKVREALDRYRDPVMAVHDGYFSTLGRGEYPKPGAAGQGPCVAGGMRGHYAKC